MNFLIIGGMRCATTYLATVLDQNPEIEMAKPFLPEPKYFLEINNKDEYLSKFTNPQLVCGEKTVSDYYGRYKE